MQSIDFPFDKYNFNSDFILDDLPEEDLRLLKKNMITHIYKKGERLFREGGYPTGIYYITKGKVKKYKTDKEGREQIFYVCKSGELLGYHALISDEHYTDSSSALDEATVSFIPKDDFLKAIQTSSILSNRLLKCMSHEFGVLVNSITIFAQRTVRERLALSLLILRDKYKREDQDGKPVELTLSRDDLANMVGTARETLTRLLRDFKVENLIEINGRKIILKNALEISKIANLY
ncbi:Crp/Fnr family transcriptional regulator [Sphingobacteriaceae bacterium]|nr:Crp/Fnr family transcriptional regulator [Sphingobacteriaceae bacterium]